LPPQAAERERVADVERLLDEVDALADPAARALALELVQALVDLYGEGLARAVARLDAAALADLASDELAAHLLLLHGLHPVTVAERVERALDEVRPYLDQHGGGVELLGVEDGVARLRLQGTCHGCPASAMTLKSAVEDALRRAAPDLDDIVAEGVTEAAPSGLLQIEMACPVAAPGAPAP
jgi:Fe-S cluster biogenesis protein NfuA